MICKFIHALHVLLKLAQGTNKLYDLNVMRFPKKKTNIALAGVEPATHALNDSIIFINNQTHRSERLDIGQIGITTTSNTNDRNMVSALAFTVYTNRAQTSNQWFYDITIAGTYI